MTSLKPKRSYSRALTTCPASLAFPPVGWAKTRPQTRHRTTMAAWEKVTCSLPQSGHLIFTNLERGWGIRTC